MAVRPGPIKIDVLLQVQGSELQARIGTIEVEAHAVNKRDDGPDEVLTDFDGLRGELLAVIGRMQGIDRVQKAEEES